MAWDEAQRNRAFAIGELASRYGVSAQTIRNWERQGAIPAARRTAGGHRRYGMEHRRALDALLALPPPAPESR